MGKRREEFNPKKATKKELIVEYEALLNICEELRIKRRHHKHGDLAAKAKLREVEAKFKPYVEQDERTKRLQRELVHVGP